MVQETTTYKEQSRVLLAKAVEELAKGDLARASEKGWGAAAQMLKAIADERGWEHNDPPDLHSVIDRIYCETEDSELMDLFCSAVFLEFSYIEGAVSADSIEHRLQRVKRFVKRADGHLHGAK